MLYLECQKKTLSMKQKTCLRNSLFILLTIFFIISANPLIFALNSPKKPRNSVYSYFNKFKFKKSKKSRQVIQKKIPPLPQNNKSEKSNYQADILIVKFKSDISQEDKGDLLKEVAVESIEPAVKPLSPRQIELASNLGLHRIYKLKLKSKSNLQNAIAILKKNPQVEYAELNLFFTADSKNIEGGGVISSQLTNDTYVDPNGTGSWSTGSWGQDYEDMWGLKKIGLELAKPLMSGNSDIIVAVSDTGIDYNHPDIQEKIWKNPEELPNDGIDNDGNGFIDDDKGWDFTTCENIDEETNRCTRYKNTDNDPIDDSGHGTHVAGTIGATTNNTIGIAGINWSDDWNIKIMPVKGLNSQGKGSTLDLANTIIYAADEGANVLNMSWGGVTYYLPETLRTALDFAYSLGVVLVASAGNGESFAYDVKYVYPANYPNLITVAMTDYQDVRDFRSNYGSKIDVAAPGIDILSLNAHGTGNSDYIVGSEYYRRSGTSMSAAHTSGLAALLLARNPDFNSEQVKAAIKQGADDIGETGWDKYTGNGRINAYNSLQISDPLIAKISYPQEDDYLVANSVAEIRGVAMGAGFQSYRLEYAEGRSPSYWNLIYSSNNPVIESDGLLFSWNTQGIAAGVYTLRLTVSAYGGQELTEIKVINLGAEAGWPQNINGDIRYPPVTGDVDGDSKKEIVFATENQVHVLRSDGTELPYWPVTFNEGVQPWGWPSLADLDSDGKLDIIFVLWNSLIEKNVLMALRFQGDVPGFPLVLPMEPLRGYGGVTSSISSNAPPVLADLDKDGKIEIILRSQETDNGKKCPVYVYAYDPDAMEKIQLKWSRDTDDYGYNSASVADINRDGSLEVVVPSISQVFAFDKDGNTFPGWPTEDYFMTAWFHHNALLGDVAGDGKLEVVVFDSAIGSQNGKCYVFDNNGNLLSQDRPIMNSTFIVLTDVDGDRKNELVGNRDILKINNDGSAQILSQWIPPYNKIVTGSFAVDIDNDETHAPEILFSGYSWESKDIDHLQAFNKDGLPLDNFDLVNFPLEVPVPNGGLGGDSIMVDDFDNDGKLELFVVSIPQNYVFSKIYMWELGAYNPESLKNSWHLPDHDAQHTNAILSTDLFVPADYSTIQTAINVSQDGDTIYVSPGTYYESIDFLGKKIKVVSEQGAQLTIIQGVVNFTSNETRDSILQGFTIQAGRSGCILISNASPSISSNIIRLGEGTAVPNFIGISITTGAPLVKENQILNFSDGEGIHINNPIRYKAEIISNVIQHNNFGIYIEGEGGEWIERNLISNNYNDGIRVQGVSRQDLPPQIIHNTISDNGDDGIEAVSPVNPTLVGNIIAYNGRRGVNFESFFMNNNYPAHGYNLTWMNNPKFDDGNIIFGDGIDDLILDPLFIDRISYQLQAASPCIDNGWPFFKDPPDYKTRADIGAFPYNQ